MTVLADIVSRIEGFQQEFKNMNKKKHVVIVSIH